MKKMNIRILGHDVEIIWSSKKITNRGSGDTSGIAICALNQIIINDAYKNKSMKRETLLHEIIEHLNYRLQLALEHEKLSAMSEGIYQVLRDNPKAVKYITGGKR